MWDLPATAHKAAIPPSGRQLALQKSSYFFFFPHDVGETILCMKYYVH